MVWWVCRLLPGVRTGKTTATSRICGAIPKGLQVQIVFSSLFVLNRDLTYATTVDSLNVTALPRCPSPPPPCMKPALTKSYVFTVTNKLSWGATRDVLRGSLEAVYRTHHIYYDPKSNILAGPKGQVRAKYGPTTWKFTATLSITSKNRCTPLGDKLFDELRKALAISGSSNIKA